MTFRRLGRLSPREAWRRFSPCGSGEPPPQRSWGSPFKVGPSPGRDAASRPVFPSCGFCLSPGPLPLPLASIRAERTPNDRLLSLVRSSSPLPEPRPSATIAVPSRGHSGRSRGLLPPATSTSRLGLTPQHGTATFLGLLLSRVLPGSRWRLLPVASSLALLPEWRGGPGAKGVEGAPTQTIFARVFAMYGIRLRVSTYEPVRPTLVGLDVPS
jgi:hypothetical protein